MSLLVGAVWATLERQPVWGRRLAAAVCLLVLLLNLGTLWTKKRAQFIARARPTELLIDYARHHPEPFALACFPRQEVVAREALHLAINRPPETLIWAVGGTPPAGVASLCVPGR